MPVRISHLSAGAEKEFRSRISNLRRMGVTVGRVRDLPKPEKFSLEQIGPQPGLVFELPGGEVATVLPARLTVRESGVMIIDSEIIPSWYDWKLDLDDLAYDKALLEEITLCSPKFRPKILNEHMVGPVAPLVRSQLEGIIVATGHTPIPANLQHGALVSMELWIRDERDAEFCFNFGARVDQSIMEIRKRLALNSRAGVTKSAGLLERVEPDDQIGFASEVPKDQRGIGISGGVPDYIVERYNALTGDLVCGGNDLAELHGSENK